MSSPAEVDDDLAALRSTIPPALWSDLAARSLLPMPEQQ
jgi:hypothetical protein